jgi:hypothetical protein
MAQSNFVVKNGLTVLNHLTATSTSTVSGAAVVYGGVGITEDVNIGGRTAFTGTVTAFSSVDILPLVLSTGSTSGALRVRGGIGVGGNIYIDNVTNSTTATEGALVVTGGVGIGGDLNVQGSITAQGNITANGNIVLGNSTSTDSLTIESEINSDLIPKYNNRFSIGSTTSYWANLYAQNVGVLNTATFQNLVVLNTATVQGIDLLAYNQNSWYVDPLVGSDTNTGLRQLDPFRTIAKAFSVANSGDTVNLLPGTFTEDFPLTIPEGVSVKGAGLREVFVQPTTATNTQTAFYLNGGTTISDFTVGNFYKPGYAFKFAETTATITLRSPYIERFTVLTRGSVKTSTDPYGYASNDAGGGGFFDGQYVSTSSIEPAVLFNEATFITPGANALVLTNGTRSELLNGFSYFADRAVYAYAGQEGWGGQGRVRLSLNISTGTFAAGQNLYYISSTGTVAASGLIDEVNGNYIYIKSNAPGFVEAADRTPKVVNVFGNPRISSFERKFGTGSVLFQANGDLLSLVNATDLQFDTGPFTIESEVFLNDNNRKQQIFNKGIIPDTTFGLYIDADNKITGQHGTTIFTGTNSISTGTWHHVAMCRDPSNNIRLFLDGNLEGTFTSVANVTNGDPLTIGGEESDGTLYLGGYLDEIRVSTTYRYTAGFTQPTAAFASDLATAVLIHGDGTDGSSVITDDGNATQIVYSTAGAYDATKLGQANQITLADYHQFGAELRCIGSAAVFGNYGVYADGAGVDLKLIAFNMSYVGSGGDLSDNPNLAIQTQEIVKLNGAEVYYQTVDHLGDFRVGDQFRINQRTGNVDFGTANFKLGPVSSLTISDGVNASILQPTSIQVGTLLLSSNSISTLAGDLRINPSGLLTTIESGLQVNGSFLYTGVFTSPNLTASTSTTTGAIVVAGGVGIGGDLYVGGNVYSAQGNPLYNTKITVSTMPPTTATNNVGDFWIDPSIGVEYQWIQDGTNFYWIQFTGV